MGLEQHSINDTGAAPAAAESPFHIQLLAEGQQQKDKPAPKEAPKADEPKAEIKQEAQPEFGRGGPPGGGGRPSGPPERPPEPPRQPEPPPRQPTGGGDGGGRGGDGGGRRPPEGPPEGPPKRPPGGGGEGGDGGGKKPPPDHPPDHPTRPPDHPGHPPIGDPHPGDPNHGFHPGRPFEPPQGGHWGWNDPGRWGRGWDPWFFRNDPNWGIWENNIESEANFIAGMLDSGNAIGAANELNQDLFNMRGDIYAQDNLINQVNMLDTKGVGADINLGPWNPVRGTWDNITITPDPNDFSTPVQSVDPFDAFGNPI